MEFRLKNKFSSARLAKESEAQPCGDGNIGDIQRHIRGCAVHSHEAHDASMFESDIFANNAGLNCGRRHTILRKSAYLRWEDLSDLRIQ